MGVIEDIGKGLGWAASHVDDAANIVGDAVGADSLINMGDDIIHGRDLDWRDVRGAALGATTFIPVAGLAGGAARMGVRAGERLLAKELEGAGARAVANNAAKYTARDLRSPLNNALRDRVGGAVPGALRRPGATVGTGLRDLAITPVTASGARGQLARIAAKQEAGIGKRVGFGQTKRTLARNTALVGAANAVSRGAGLKGFDKKGDSKSGQGSVQNGSDPGGYGFYLMDASGGAHYPPPGMNGAELNAWLQQNGSAAGMQVVTIR